MPKKKEFNFNSKFIQEVKDIVGIKACYVKGKFWDDKVGRFAQIEFIESKRLKLGEGNAAIIERQSVCIDVFHGQSNKEILDNLKLTHKKKFKTTKQLIAKQKKAKKPSRYEVLKRIMKDQPLKSVKEQAVNLNKLVEERENETNRKR